LQKFVQASRKELEVVENGLFEGTGDGSLLGSLVGPHYTTVIAINGIVLGYYLACARGRLEPTQLFLPTPSLRRIVHALLRATRSVFYGAGREADEEEEEGRPWITHLELVQRPLRVGVAEREIQQGVGVGLKFVVELFGALSAARDDKVDILVGDGAVARLEDLVGTKPDHGEELLFAQGLVLFCKTALLNYYCIQM
jgi:hypothetical protein